MEEDPLFNLDIVREFMISKGSKVTNHDLVTHFKSFLNDPMRKVANREKFKEYVNTLSQVKVGTSGEKVLVLKKKFRDFCASASELPLQRHEVKREKKKEKTKEREKTPPVAAAAAAEPEPVPKPEPHVVSQVVPQSEPQAEEPQAEPRPVPTINIHSSQDESPPKVSPETVPDTEPALSGAAAASSSSLSQTPIEADPDSVFETPPESREHTPEREVPPPVEPSVETRLPEPALSSVCNEHHHGSAPSPDVWGDEAAAAPPEVLDSPDEPMMYDVVDGVAPVPLPSLMSVKERAKHLNKMESDSNIQNSKMRRHDRSHSQPEDQIDGAAVPDPPTVATATEGEKREDDSSSVSSAGYAMDHLDREWMITSAQADYHPMFKLLNQKPELAYRKDVISGFCALHWAAKHGKAEVVKLLCKESGVNVNLRSNGGYTALHLAAMHGHEDIIELLVHVYSAEANIRDYSGKKPKQYLRNSASTRTQLVVSLSEEILAARRPNAGGVNGSHPFRRVGSYSAKIQKSGFFGITGGTAIRTSWTSASDVTAERGSPSPSPSPSLSPTPSPRPSPRQSPIPSPRASRKGSGQDAHLMPPPAGPSRGTRKEKKRRKADKENQQQHSRMPRPHSEPANLLRAGSNPELSSATTSRPVPVHTSPFV